MAQRYNFTAQTNIGNIAPGVLPTDVATVSQLGGGGSTSLAADWTALYNNGGALCKYFGHFTQIYRDHVIRQF